MSGPFSSCSSRSSCGLPDAFMDPITHELMIDPVCTADGHTYDRVSIEEWFAMGKRTSPITNLRLETTKITPNITMKKAIDDLIEDGRRRGSQGPVIGKCLTF